MKLVLLFGDGAVGKMTVGQELAKITDLKLFHNHMTIEPVLDIFGSFRADIVLKMRDLIFEEFAKTDNYGLIFTFMWAFDEPMDWQIVENITKIFTKYNAEIYYVELDAPLEIRLARNKTKNRLMNKPSKRDVAASDERLLQDDAKHRFISNDGELPFNNFLRVNNTYIPANEAAKLIKEHFKL